MEVCRETEYDRVLCEIGSELRRRASIEDTGLPHSIAGALARLLTLATKHPDSPLAEDHPRDRRGSAKDLKLRATGARTTDMPALLASRLPRSFCFSLEFFCSLIPAGQP
jgi:hypothetical protein